jgi:hypothetical protein
MNRPEHVRCENCVAWRKYLDAVEDRPAAGVCRLRHDTAHTRSADDFCVLGFREEWPATQPQTQTLQFIHDEDSPLTEPHRFGITSGCMCGKCDSCIERGLQPFTS